MSKSLNPTTRTIRKLEADGWMAGEVERRITRYLKMDLFGVADIIAVHAGQVMLVQVTTNNGGNSSAHIKKIKAEPRARRWLSAHNRTIQVWAWWVPKRTGQWEPKITEITLADLAPAPVEGT